VKDVPSNLLGYLNDAEDTVHTVSLEEEI